MPAWMPSRHADESAPRIRVYLDSTLTVAWYHDYEAQGLPTLTIGREAARRVLSRKGLTPERALAEALAWYFRAGSGLYTPRVKDLLPGAQEFLARRDRELSALADEDGLEPASA